MARYDLVYIGSTCSPLRVRLAGHRNQYNNWLKGGSSNYITSFKLFENNGVPDIELVEDCPCERKEQLHAREKHWIRNTPGCVNKLITGWTRTEYYNDNRDLMLEKAAEYRENNTELIRETQNKYRENNRELLREKFSEYYKNNRELILKAAAKRHGAPHTCEICNIIGRWGDKSRHEKTQRHIRNLSAQNKNVNT